MSQAAADHPARSPRTERRRAARRRARGARCRDRRARDSAPGPGVHLTLEQRARLHGAPARVGRRRSPRSGPTSPRTSKGLEPGHPLRGEDWLGGPVRRGHGARRVPLDPAEAREGREPAEGREDGCRARRPRAGARLPADARRRPAAVGLHRRGVVRARRDRRRGAPRPPVSASSTPTAARRGRARARRRQRHLDPGARRAVRTAREQPRRAAQAQPHAGPARAGLRARARAAHRARLRADRPRRRRRRRVPHRPPRHRPRPHHRRRADVRRDRVGSVDGAGRRAHRAPQAREPPAAQEADHRRARRRLADHRRARASGPTPTCASRPSTSRRCGCRTPATTASPARSC